MNNRGVMTANSDFNGFFNAPKKKSPLKVIWDSEEKTFFRRTAIGWAKIIFFYIVFYLVLAALFVFCWYIFSLTLSADKPKYTDIIGNNPGLSTSPAPRMTSDGRRRIHFRREAPEYWTKQMRRFLKDSTDVDDDKDFDSCGKDHFGFDVGKPCIFLKLNKIMNWHPEFYKSLDELPEAMPESLKNHIKSSNDLKVVWVSCEGDRDIDKENLGREIAYNALNSEQGFHERHFPFNNQPDYKQPFVVVKFNSVKPGVPVKILCKAWAKNIQHDRQNLKGLTRFELIVE